jgi:hypothetical protein
MINGVGYDRLWGSTEVGMVGFWFSSLLVITIPIIVIEYADTMLLGEFSYISLAA